MLALNIPSFKVPGLEGILIYHDHKDPFHFYYANSHPRIATYNGVPELSYRRIDRNANQAKIGTNGTQEDAKKAESMTGFLSLTVNLALNEEEQKSIDMYIKENVLVSSYKETTIKTYYNDQYKKYLLLDLKNVSYTLSPIEFKSGNASLSLLKDESGSFVKNCTTEVKPNLTGNCNASFVATYGNEGAQYMYNILKKEPNIVAGKEVPTDLTVYYNMKFAGYLPFTAKVVINSSSFYSYLKDFTSSLSGIDASYRGPVKVPAPWNDVIPDKVYSNGAVLCLSKGSLDSLISNCRVQKDFINIQIEDMSANVSDDENQEICKTLTDTILSMVSNTLIPRIFDRTSLPVEVKDEEPAEKSEGKDNEEGKRKKNLFDTYYSIKKDERSLDLSILEFNLSKSGSAEMEFNASGPIGAILDGYTVDDYVSVTSLDSLSSEIVAVPINVHANFELDKVAQVDVKVKVLKTNVLGTKEIKSESFVLKKDNANACFWYNKSYNDDGTLATKLQYSTRITYTGKNYPGQEWTDFKEPDKDSDIITILYKSLGYLNVTFTAGDIDWNLIKYVTVSIDYPAAGNKSDTKGMIKLDQDNLAASWNCYKYGQESDDYTYKIKYYYHDGNEVEGKEEKDNQENITVNDMLEGYFKLNFPVSLGDAKRVYVEVKYEDPKLGISEIKSHTFTNSGDWTYETRLQTGSIETVTYRYTVENQDGVTMTTAWMGPVGNNGDVIKLEKKELTIMLFFDFATQWRTSLLTITYDDSAHDFHYKRANMQINGDNPTPTISILALEKSDAAFKVSGKLVSMKNKIVTLSETVCTDDAFIPEEPVIE